jgi:hypothetical protein
MIDKNGVRQRNDSFVSLNPLNGDLTCPSLKRKFLAIHRSVKLEWIAKELHRGVRSGATGAEPESFDQLVRRSLGEGLQHGERAWPFR